MADHQDRIDDLLKRLEQLMQQQESFAREVQSLRNELNALKGTQSQEIQDTASRPEQIIPETPSVSSAGDPWPDHVDLSELRAGIVGCTEGTTSGGTGFIKFAMLHNGVSYVALCAANGNWIVQDVAENLIAKGRFRNGGKTVIVTQGVRQGDIVTEQTIEQTLLKAAGLHMTGTRVNPAPQAAAPQAVSSASTPAQPREQSGLETFIGQNLIAVIAVIVLLIGVVFGVKYSIDHNLISPLTRIILSYLLGMGILFAGIRFRKKYELFSAILVSGSMAIMYVTTFVAYSLYGLLPQMAAFAVMVLFTVFTVIASIQYNRQIMAHIALVASYGIPFLLSNGSGNVTALFSYMLLVNAGILVTSFMRNWKPLYYVAFGFTWLIYVLWSLDGYVEHLHFAKALLFGALFFVEFYAMFLVYKLIRKEMFGAEDVSMILLNSIIYYGIGYTLLDGERGEEYLGLFTLGFAVAHFAVSIIMYMSKLADKNLFYLTSGMVLSFLTLAVPVQLDGNWVTLIWALEATVMFSIGRSQAVRIYEYLSYPVMVFSLVSLSNDWVQFYAHPAGAAADVTVFGHIVFFSTLLVAVLFGGISYVDRREKFRIQIMQHTPELTKLMSVVINVSLILIVYNMCRLEMDLYWDQLYRASRIEHSFMDSPLSFPIEVYDDNLLSKKHIWNLNYTLIFLAVLAWIDQIRIRSRVLGGGILVVSTLAVLGFLTIGLYELSVLRAFYLSVKNGAVFQVDSSVLLLRYLSIAILGGFMYTLSRYLRGIQSKGLRILIELLMHTTVLWVLCSELINVLDLMGSNAQHKLGLSILSGLYAFVLVGLGIWKRKQYLRIAAISLFGLVLVKLFFYDIAHLSTIAKTIVFITLGVILLLISFLYNKYKDKIAGPHE